MSSNTMKDNKNTTQNQGQKDKTSDQFSSGSKSDNLKGTQQDSTNKQQDRR